MTQDEVAIAMARDAAEGETYQALCDKYAEFYEGRLDYPTRGWVCGKLRWVARQSGADSERAHDSGEDSPASHERVDKHLSVSHGGAEKTTNDAVRISEYEFTDLDTEAYALPRFTGHLRIVGDCVVIGDVHLPTTDWRLAELVVTVAKALGIKTLLIVGDWVNLDVFSYYDHIVPPVPLTVELQVSAKLARRYASWFDRMILMLGNHEHRILKVSKGDLNSTALGRLLSASGGKLQVSPYSHIEIMSGGVLWRATHQKNYSKIRGRVGDELAQKYQCNVITHHQHHVAKIMDRWGRYVVIDNGGLFDAEKMAYVMLRDSISVTMTKGFTVLLNGTGHLLTPYPAYTDLELWLERMAAKLRRAA